MPVVSQFYLCLLYCLKFSFRHRVLAVEEQVQTGSVLQRILEPEQRLHSDQQFNTVSLSYSRSNWITCGVSLNCFTKIIIHMKNDVEQEISSFKDRVKISIIIPLFTFFVWYENSDCDSRILSGDVL